MTRSPAATGTDIQIRQAVSSDAPAVASLLQQAQQVHMTGLPEQFCHLEPDRALDFFRSLIAMGQNTILIAWQGKMAVGFVEFHHQMVGERNGMYPRSYVHVNSLAVDAGQRRHGIGRRLMQAVEQWAQEHEVDEVVLNVYEFNRAAIEFYEALGYDTYSRKMSRRVS